MILAAGRGTRLAPFTDWRPKPALPVRGLPVVAYLMEMLAARGVREVIVNLHHLGGAMRAVVERYRPAGLEVCFSEEEKLLGTGGALRRARPFLRESDPSLVLAGDMILDADLEALVRRHRERRDLATLLLRRDERAARFGTIGIDEEGAVRRIGRDFDLGGEAGEGLFVGVRCLAARAFDDMPETDAFEDLRDWLAPRIRAGERDVRAESMADDAVWEPVGTPEEYLSANLRLPHLSFIDADARARAGGARLGPDWVVGAGADVDPGCVLERAVIWDGEKVPPGTALRDGIFAGGAFHPCAERSAAGATDG
jgi:NDP-sugar pyrophosphorylase family protein